MRKIRLTIQYDGSSYNGWQVQPRGATVQGLLEDVIEKITGERVHVIGAGRTDAGVHAIEQVASFGSSSGLTHDVLKRALNALLPRDVKIIAVEDSEADFHPRFSSVRKRYVYLIANTETVPVFVDRYVWRIRFPLNVEQMSAASVFILGSHDFSSFRGAGCNARNSVREVYSLDVEKSDEMQFLFSGFRGAFIKFSIEADGFLRHMVRNIVGTLVEVGRGRIGSEALKDILVSRERRFAGPTAPAKGLFLERVIYTL